MTDYIRDGYYDDLGRKITWMYRVDLEHIVKMYRSTIFMIIVNLELYRDTLFMTIVDPEKYHDLVLLVVSSLVSFVSVPAVASFSVSLVCVGDPDTSVFPVVLSQDSLSKRVQWRTESIGNSRSTGRHPVRIWISLVV